MRADVAVPYAQLRQTQLGLRLVFKLPVETQIYIPPHVLPPHLLRKSLILIFLVY